MSIKRNLDLWRCCTRNGTLIDPYKTHDGSDGTLASRAIRWLRLSIAASVVAPLAVLIAAAWYTRQATLTQAQISAERTVATLAEHALKVFETQRLVLNQAEEHVQGLNWDQIRGASWLQGYLAWSIKDVPQIDSLWLIAPSGHLAAASIPNRVDPLSRADREYFVAAQNGAEWFIGRPHLGRITNLPVVDIVQRRSAADGHFDGLVLATLDPAYFVNYWRSIAPPEAYRIALYRQDGILVVTTDTATINSIPSLEGKLANSFRKMPDGVWIGPSFVDGVNRIRARRTLPGFGTVLLYGIAVEDVLAGWRQTVVAYCIVAVGASAALTGAMLLALRWVRREQQAARHQHETDVALQARDALYAGVFEKTADGIFVVSVDANGRMNFEACNPALASAIGLRAEDVVGCTPEAVFEGSDAAQLNAHFQECLEQGKPVSFTAELTIQGQRSIWQTNLTPIHDTDQRSVRLVGTTSNVTRQRELEERLRQAQKLEAIGRLTGGIAHDFNNLLTVILGNLGFLKGTLEQTRHRRLLEAAVQAADRAAVITRQMLTFGRRQMFRLELFDLTTLLSELENMIRSAATQAVALNYNLAEYPTVAAIDRTEFELAVLNIAVNARHAMPDGGRLMIRSDIIRVGRKTPELAEHLLPVQYVRLSFSDTGHGMTEAVRKRAFEPYYTTKDVGQGSGLGLSQVYGFIKQSGGHAELESAVGNGTTVILYLPLRDTEVGGQDKEVAAAVKSELNLTVLVVDDTIEVRETVVAILENAGCTTLQAGSGYEALAAIREHCERLDLLLTDIVMPGDMSGLMLAEQASRICPGLRVMLMTGYADTQRGLSKHTVLKKPFKQDDLVLAVKAAIGG